MQMHPFRIVILLLFFQWHTSFGQSSLQDLYRDKNYFQLRKTFRAQYKNMKPADRLFYQAVLDNTFNRPEKSEQAIAQFRDRFPQLLTDSLRKTLLNLEADNAIKTYQYQKAANAYRTIIGQYKTDSSERADLENSFALWDAIAKVPPQEVIQKENAILTWRKDQIGLLLLQVNSGKDSSELVFDTGANISVITETTAKKLHMQVYAVRLDLGAGTTGQTIQSSLAVADSLWLGPILLRHVVFLLLPDDMLYFKQANYHQQGIIGEPLMAQLKQLIFYGNGRLEIPLNPVSSPYSNLALDGAMPIVEYEVKGQRLPFRFDCGASTSVLYAPFYHRFKDLVKANGKPYQLRTGGVGGTINTTDAFQLSNLAIGVSNRTFTIPKINVRTTPVGEEPDLFYGNMGLDMFGHFQQLTIDFTAMSLEVK
jgi:hypothetical protein